MGLARTSGERETPARAVIWHDLECGSYRADLPLWRELASSAAQHAPLLEVGAGSGRVSLDLARRGHQVTALDSDAELLGALRERAGELPLATVHADARSFQLERRDFALCLVPMQTLQLLGGSRGRLAFLRRAREHLRPGALLACAIVTALEAFDSASDGVRPSPELVRIADELYRSQAIGVRVGTRSARIERERQVTAAARADQLAPADARRERYVVELDHVSVAVLEREGGEAGLEPAGVRTIAATSEHVGSLVVMFRA